MAKDYSREQRVGDFIQRELGTTIQQEMKDPRVGLVSINEVDVSPDLGYADVYVSALDTRDEAARGQLIEVLQGAAGWLRSLIAKRTKMRKTPRLRFHWDTLPERGSHLQRVIEAAVADDAARHRNEED